MLYCEKLTAERTRMNLSIIIPAFNESENIKKTIEELLIVTKKIKEIKNVQIIVVDDHSSDNTFEIVKNLDNPKIICLRLSRQGGSHTAIRAALKETSSDLVLCVSADGQDDTTNLKGMLDKWRQGANIVWALRKNREIETPFYRFCANNFYAIMNWLTGNKNQLVDQSRADFFLLDKTVVDAINSCQEQQTNLFGLLSWLGFNQDFIEYDRRTRRHGKSKWGFKGALYMAKLWILTFSGLPLKIISIIGFAISISGLLYGIHVVYNVFFGRPSAGWSSIMCAILLLGGIQIIMLGVIGEYLWRNLEESRRRPIFFIEKRSTKIKF